MELVHMPLCRGSLSEECLYEKGSLFIHNITDKKYIGFRLRVDLFSLASLYRVLLHHAGNCHHRYLPTCELAVSPNRHWSGSLPEDSCLVGPVHTYHSKQSGNPRNIPKKKSRLKGRLVKVHSLARNCKLVLTFQTTMGRFNPFTLSDRSQISLAASPVILYHTVWRTWLFIAYSDERRLYNQFSLIHSYLEG